MPFCTKCGNKMNEEDLFCMKCGAKVFKDGETQESSSPVIQDPAPSQNAGIDKKEMLMLLDRYLNITKELDEIDMFLDKNKMAVVQPPRKHSMIKFYWPWFIVAPITTMAFFILSTLIIRRGNVPIPMLMILVLSIVMFFVLLIVGSVSSRHKRDALNAQVDKQYAFEVARAKEIEEKKERKQVLLAERQPMDPMIPQPYRTQTKLSKMLSLLKTNQVQTLDEAIAAINS